MTISDQKFEQIIEAAIYSLPKKFLKRLNNVAVFIAEEPGAEQLKKIKLTKGDLVFGLFEGYAQAKRLNFGPVLPDRITIFKKAILSQSASEAELKQKITNTVKHEIAHHFGSDETGAAKAASS